MKRFLQIFLSILPFVSFSQAPGIQWQKSLGGTGTDQAYGIIQTSDGGYLTVGSSNSNNGNVTGNHGGNDFWVVKLNSAGAIQWQKSYGGSGDDWGTSVQATADGGYIVGGFSYSNDGDVSGHHGSLSNADVWVIKISSTGTIQWQKSYGGSGDDRLNAILVVNGGYILGTQSNSNDGDVTNNHGDYDAWIAKIDTAGAIVWENSFGGSSIDITEKIIANKEGGYTAAVQSQSNDGDVSGNNGGFDYWVIKLSATGSLLWQKCYGGISNDLITSIAALADSSYVITGGSTSANNGDITGNHGGYDYWVVKINKTGAIIWEKSYGGSNNDFCTSIKSTADGGFVLTGHSMSNDGDVTGSHGGSECWLVKISGSDSLEWERSLGGSADEFSFEALPTSDAGYIVANISNSNNGDVSGNHGDKDYWIVKMNPDPLLGPKVSISAKPGTTVCSHTVVVLTAKPTNTDASVVYQWKKNNINVGSNGATYTDSLLNNGDSVICVITDASKTATSNKLKFVVNPLINPSVSITANPGSEVCVGAKVVFTAITVNGGTAPKFLWKKNGVSVGTDTTSYTDSIPKSGDSIAVTLTSNAACVAAGSVASNVVKIKVDATDPVITILANKDTTICSKTTVTFTAAVNPIYQWKKDGIVVGNNTSTYKDSLLRTGDYIQCFIVSGVSACNGSSSNIINSNQLKFKVNTAPAQPSVVTGPVNVPSGQKGVYFSIIPVAGVTYAWTLPTGAVIDSGQGGNKIKVDWGSTGGNISVIAINSCGSSPARTFTVGVTGLTAVGGINTDNVVAANKGVKLFPNPASTTATLQFTSKAAVKYAITILDGDNNVMEVKSGVSVVGTNVVKINAANYAKGVYYITIIDKENGQRSVEFVKGE